MVGPLTSPGILYLHGFCSSPASLKSRQFAAEMARRGLADRFVSPTLSPVPAQAMADMARLLDDAPGPVTLVGSSLGGHYATCLAERYGLDAVLVNPAAVDRLDAARFIGEHTNFHTGEQFTFTAEHAAQLAAQVVVPTPSRYWLLADEGDEVLDWRQAADFYAGCQQTILPGGDHSFARFPGFIPQIIEFAGL